MRLSYKGAVRDIEPEGTANIFDAARELVKSVDGERGAYREDWAVDVDQGFRVVHSIEQVQTSINMSLEKIAPAGSAKTVRCTNGHRFDNYAQSPGAAEDLRRIVGLEAKAACPDCGACLFAEKMDEKYGGEVHKIGVGSPHPFGHRDVVPADEWILFRAKDDAFPATLQFYREECARRGADAAHLDGIDRLIQKVTMWRAAHPEKCKVPGP